MSKEQAFWTVFALFVIALATMSSCARLQSIDEHIQHHMETSR